MLIRFHFSSGRWQATAIEFDEAIDADHRNLMSRGEGQLTGLGAVVPDKISVATTDGKMVELNHHERAMTLLGDCVQYVSAGHDDPPAIPGRVSGGRD